MQGLSLLPRRGVVACASASAASEFLDKVIWHRTLTSFYLRAGAAARSMPRPTLSHPRECARPAPAASLFGLVRKHWELPVFSGIVQSPLLFVRWRHKPLEGWECVCGREQGWCVGGGRV